MLLKTEEEAQNALGGSDGVGVTSGIISTDSEHQLTDDGPELESPIHPLGIKPLGNKLLSDETTDAREAIGGFRALPDGTRKWTTLEIVFLLITCVGLTKHLQRSLHNF